MNESTKSELRWYHQYLSFCKVPSLWKTSPCHITIPEFDLQQDSGKVAPSWFENFELNNGIRLGKRMERFFSLFLQQSDRYDLLGENIQIKREKRTIGELDFLVIDLQKQQHIHVELVNKLYVYNPSEGNHELERWIGPNRKDGVLQKMYKLEKQQFPLLDAPETRETLSDMGLHTGSYRQAMCFKALLFVPQKYQGKILPLVNNDCIQGIWIRITDFTMKDYGQHCFFLPEKQDWFVDPVYQVKWCSYGEMYDAIITVLDQKRAPLCWMKKEEEYFRFFVVWW